MADDTKKYLEQLAKENAESSLKGFRHLDTNATDIMDMNDIVDSEDTFGRAIKGQEFQDKVQAENRKKGVELLERAKSRGRDMKRAPIDSAIGDKVKMLDRDIINNAIDIDAMKKPSKKSIAQKILKKLGSGVGKKAAGLAIGGPLSLMSEMADAAEIGISPRDKIIESTRSPEEKKALLRGIDMKRKLAGESGDVSQDPVVLKAKEIGDRLQQRSNAEMTEKKATDKFDRKVSKEEYGNILKQLRDANRRK